MINHSYEYYFVCIYQIIPPAGVITITNSMLSTPMHTDIVYITYKGYFMLHVLCLYN